MEHAIRLVLGVLALIVAACGGGSSSVTREPGVTTADGSVADAGHDSRTSSSAVSLDGLWVATDDPPTLLRYPDGASEPADAVDLEFAPQTIEIVDGVAFYLEDVLVSNTLFVQSLKDGERAEIAFAENSALSGLVLADGSLWIGDEAQDVVWRVNPNTLEIIGGTHLDNYDSDQNDGLQLATSADSVYVSSLFGDSAVLRIGTKSDLVEARQEEGGDGPTGIAVGEGSAWAVSRFDGALWQYQERELTLVQSIALEADISSSPRNVVAAFGSVFVLAGNGGNVSASVGERRNLDVMPR